MVDEAVQFAVAAASLKVTRQGAQAGMPHRNEILKMLRRM
jgi:sugar/nucleoside kinase (ribokinase family)